jgi:hypothetical protein
MDTLKKIFPLAFVKKKDVAALVINILIHIVVGVVLGVAIAILHKIPVVNIIVGAVSGLGELYILISIILSVLDYLNILK